MSTNRRPRIAVLLDHIESEYPVTILNGILRAARLSRTRVVVIPGGWLPASSDPPIARNFIYEFLRDAGFDGIVVLAGSLSNYCGVDPFRAWLRRLDGIPTVALGLAVEGVPSIYVDNGVGTYAAVTHLIREHARRRIAFIAGPVRSWEANARLQAYKQALEDNEITVDPRLIVAQNGLGREEGLAGVATLLDDRRIALPALNAIVAVNDDVALGAMEALHRRGIGVPDPVAVVGFDDTTNAGSANPPLMTVNQRVELQGYNAARALLDHLQGRLLVDERMEPELVIRASCGCSARDAYSSKLVSLPKGLAKSCRLALVERRATFLAEMSRAAAGRLSGANGWEASLLDALASEMDPERGGKFVRQLERVVRQNAMLQHGLMACHDVLTTIRVQALQCAAAEPNLQPLLEELFQEARIMVARVSADVGREHRQAANLHLRVVTKSCINLAAAGTFADLDDVLQEHLPALGVAAFSIGRFVESSGVTPNCEIIAHRSRGLTRRQSTLVPSFEVGLDASLDNEEMTIIEPLEFGSQPLGIAAFSWGAFDALMYEQLRELLGMAIYVGRNRGDAARESALRGPAAQQNFIEGHSRVR